MDKELTIIIPTYNDGLEKNTKTLESIMLQQNYDLNKLEIIIVDDNSTNSINWQELLNKYPMLQTKYVKLNENKGPGVARQMGLDISCGKYVFFLDCGDKLYDNDVLKKFADCVPYNKDIIISKLYDEEFPKRRVSYNLNNSYIFGIFIKKLFLNENSIQFSQILRWEEDAYFEQLLRFYRPSTINTKSIGYTYSNDSNSITRNSDHEYANKLRGFSSMVTKSMLICNFYMKKNDFEGIVNEVSERIISCYSRLYNALFEKNILNERINKLIYLLKCFIFISLHININSNELYQLLEKQMIKTNSMYKMQGRETIPGNKLYDFLKIIQSSENIYGNYKIEGTNITINELENYILETNHKQSSIKKH